jgi:hypothetical protein
VCICDARGGGGWVRMESVTATAGSLTRQVRPPLPSTGRKGRQARHDSARPWHDSARPWHVSARPWHDSARPWHDSARPWHGLTTRRRHASGHGMARRASLVSAAADAGVASAQATRTCPAQADSEARVALRSPGSRGGAGAARLNRGSRIVALTASWSCLRTDTARLVCS